jgi:penicillin amidase
MRRRLPRALLVLVATLLLVAAVGAVWARARLRASLPVLDGQIRLAGLAAPVSIDRDGLGVPWIRGRSRQDVVRATGFLHAQERFFQMDLARRRAAGELAELVGDRAVPLDREIRIHRFRAEARHAVELLAPADRALLDAYADGVNAGLHSLGASPFEYTLLRQAPQEWRPEDTFLVILSMFVTLQDSEGAFESSLATMHEVLPPPMVAFLNPRGTEWDAPVIGESFPTAPVPGPDVYDLRTRRAGKPPVTLPPPRLQTSRLDPGSGAKELDALLAEWDPRALRDGALGSNNWAVSGPLTKDGHALLANDMHLSIRVPNTWYRAAMEWPDATEPSGRHTVFGVTLPGVPGVVVGSNTHVAWGFTNTYADWSDIVMLDVDTAHPERYRTVEGWRDVERYDETIRVARAPDVHLSVAWTMWGPVMPPDYKGRQRAYRWVAHDAARLATAMVPLESAKTIEDVFDAANGRGTPGQNILAADTTGRIGWSVFGAIPRRVGLSGELPASWADGTRGWNGWLDRNEYPRIVDPQSGRLWTANNRVVGGEMLARLGEGNYEVGSRASIIRDRLLAGSQFTVRDLLSIQLDNSATYLSRWRDLLIRTLTPAATAGQPLRSEIRDVLEHGWSGRASLDSAAYRFVRTFRDEVAQRVAKTVLAECYEADPAFDYFTVRRREGAVWKLVTEKPLHLLDPQYSSWDALLLDAIDTVIASATAEHSGPLRDRTWAEYNVSSFRHPLSASLPLFGRWLDMPAQSLPGDLFTPRMHWGTNGASERMVVSPGHEDEGIMEMPTGQSGHPLSPFYRSSHEAWVNGQPSPFLPGRTEYRLTLEP